MVVKACDRDLENAAQGHIFFFTFWTDQKLVK